MRALGALLLAFAIVSPSPAAAQLYRRDPPRLELGLGVDFALLAAGAPVLFAFSAAVHALRALAVGVVVRAAVSDPERARVEVLGSVEASWVDEPRLPDPPALRLAASLELGWMTRAGDVDGVLVAIGGEIGLVVFEDVAVALRLQAAAAPADGHDDFAPELRGGLVMRTLFGD